MAMALAISGLTAYSVAMSPGLIQLIYSSQLGIWAIIIAELVLV